MEEPRGTEPHTFAVPIEEPARDDDGSCPPVGNQVQPMQASQQDVFPTIVTHHGSSGYYPENANRHAIAATLLQSEVQQLSTKLDEKIEMHTKRIEKQLDETTEEIEERLDETKEQLSESQSRITDEIDELKTVVRDLKERVDKLENKTDPKQTPGEPTSSEMPTQSAETGEAHSSNPLKFTRCCNLPKGMCDPQSVLLKGRVCVSGGNTGTAEDEAMVYVYDREADGWDRFKAPTKFTAVATYNNQLTLLGGRNAADDKRTNQVWVYNEQNLQWEQPIPPMSANRSSASAISIGKYLIVVGGLGDKWQEMNTVEVFDGYKWIIADSLPTSGYVFRTVYLNGYFYIMGGYPPHKFVFYCSLKSLIEKATLPPHLPKPPKTVWRTLPIVKYELSSAVVLGNPGSLYSVGGWNGREFQDAVYKYDPVELSWSHIGELPKAIYAASTTTLPNGKALLIGGRSNTALCSPLVFSLEPPTQ